MCTPVAVVEGLDDPENLLEAVDEVYVLCFWCGCGALVPHACVEDDRTAVDEYDISVP